MNRDQFTKECIDSAMNQVWQGSHLTLRLQVRKQDRETRAWIGGLDSKDNILPPHEYMVYADDMGRELLIFHSDGLNGEAEAERMGRQFLRQCLEWQTEKIKRGIAPNNPPATGKAPKLELI